MLPVILLGVIARLAVVSADCDIGNINLSHTNGTKVSYSVRHIMLLILIWENKMYYTQVCPKLFSGLIVYRYLVLALPHSPKIQ
jgi:hypothetical protein